MPDYLSREAWGAQHDTADELVATPAKRAFLHHSVTNPDDDSVYEATGDVAADMRELERIAWDRFRTTVSYSWAAHPSGWAGEGCGLHVGSHTKGYNSTTFGVAAIGNYDVNPPGAVLLETIAGILADLVRWGKLDPAFVLTPHKNAPEASTACPGRHLAPHVPAIRARVTDMLTPPPVELIDPATDSFPNAVDAALCPTGGSWVLGADGGVGAYGGAPFYGSLPSIGVLATATAILATPTGQGYWVQGSDGGIFTFGDAAWHGSYTSLPPEDRQDVGIPRRFPRLLAGVTGLVQLADDGGVYRHP